MYWRVEVAIDRLAVYCVKKKKKTFLGALASMCKGWENWLSSMLKLMVCSIDVTGWWSLLSR